MIELAPSLLSANFANLEKDIQELDENGCQFLHLDVMDGTFVPNISYGASIIRAIRGLTPMTFDVHLMVEEPDRFLKDFVEAGADYLTIHYEATRHVERTLKEISSFGIKAGIALNPATPLCALDYLMDAVDLVLVMTVNPGFGGQSYIESMDAKIAALRERIDASEREIILAVDGGIKRSNVTRVLDTGGELIVSGSDVFGDRQIGKRVREFRKIFDEYER
jgi:ribulose-phosphate 3-epimerase